MNHFLPKHTEEENSIEDGPLQRRKPSRSICIKSEPVRANILICISNWLNKKLLHIVLRDRPGTDEGQGEENKGRYGVGVSSEDLVTRTFQSGCFEQDV